MKRSRNLIFPKQCLSCQKIGEYLCSHCKKQLIPHPEICPCCHKYSQDYRVCLDCRMDKATTLEGIIIPFSYTGIIKSFIFKLKYFHKKDLGQFLAQRMALWFLVNQNIQHQFKNWVSAITYVPSHWRRRYFVKWYNQSKILAKYLSQELDIVAVAVTKKHRHTKSQASLWRKQRFSNLKNSFSLVNEEILKHVHNLIIVDDVTTTGATLSEISKTVKQKFPQIQIRWLVVARHQA